MEKSEIFDLLKRFGVEIKDTSLKAIENEFDDYIWKQRKIAVEKQKQKDTIAAIVALCDAGITEEKKLHDLLYEHFYIDSRTEADSYIRVAKTVKFPLKKLRDYLKQEGYTLLEIRNFIESKCVKEKLEGNPRLCMLPIEELKDFLEEN